MPSSKGYPIDERFYNYPIGETRIPRPRSLEELSEDDGRYEVDEASVSSEIYVSYAGYAKGKADPGIDLSKGF